MRYEGPLPLTRTEILERLAQPDLDWADRSRAILGAMYNSDGPEFPCALLLAEFQRAGDEVRPYAANMIGSFYGMWGTTHRIDKATEMVRALAESDPINAAHLAEIAEDLVVHKAINGAASSG